VVGGKLVLQQSHLDQLNLAEQQGFFFGTVRSIKRNKDTNLKLSSSKLMDTEIEVSLSFGELPVYRDWDHFLQSTENRIYRNSEFALLSEGCEVFRSGSENPLYLKYVDVVSILKHLNNAKDHGARSDLWVFTRRSKLELKIDYTKEQLEKCDLDCHSLFIKTMQEGDKHMDEKQSIIQEVLAKMLGSKSPQDRFPWLLKHFKEFFIQFEYSYRMFASNFSFDKMRKEYEEQYREYSVKLNTALSDVSTKALAVPAALIFSVSKFESDLTTASAIWLNWLMVVGVVLISVLVIFLAITHWHSLYAIETEYQGLMKRLYMELESNDSEDASSIDTLLEQLDKRTSLIRWLLGAVGLVAVVSMIGTIGYAAYLHSVPVPTS